MTIMPNSLVFYASAFIIMLTLQLFAFEVKLKGYGDCSPKTRSYVVCKGRKPKNSTRFSVRPIYDGDIISDLDFNFTVLENMGPMQMTFTLFKMVNGRYTKTVRLNYENICTEATSSAYLFPRVGTVDSKCILQKAPKKRIVLNLKEALTAVAQFLMFHGNFLVYIALESPSSNACCLTLNYTCSPGIN